MESSFQTVPLDPFTHSTGVPLETAIRWESEDHYAYRDFTRLLDSQFACTISIQVDNYFVTARTKSWSTLRNDYWASQQPAADDDVLQRAIALARRERIGKEFYGFLHLPRELRDMIYRNLLVKGGIMLRNCDDTVVLRDMHGNMYKRYEKVDIDPYTAYIQSSTLRYCQTPRLDCGFGLIYAVSHAIQPEAEKIFFGCNRFVLPAGPVNMASYSYHMRRCLDNLNPLLVRDLSHTFDMRGNAKPYDVIQPEDYARRDRVDSGSLSQLEALQHHHNERTEDLEWIWVECIDVIKQMTLDRLQLSFEDCYCPFGCCRKVGWVLDRFVYKDLTPDMMDNDDDDAVLITSHRGWALRPPLVVEVIGWSSDSERAMIHDKLRQLAATSPEPLEIRFVAPRLDSKIPPNPDPFGDF